MSETKDCNNCANKCKKDSPCPFHQEKKRTRLEELLDSLNEDMSGFSFGNVAAREREEEDRRQEVLMDQLMREQRYGYYPRSVRNISMNTDSEGDNEDGNGREE